MRKRGLSSGDVVVSVCVAALFLLFAVVPAASALQFDQAARGASGAPIWIYDSDLHVKHVEVADLNGDLVDDVIAGEYSSDNYGDPSRVIAINGVDGDTLWTYLLQDGVRSMTIGDINGDGVADVIAGAAYYSTQTPDGYVHAINGVDGSQLWAFYIGATIQCVAIGDFDGDLYLDVAAGSFDDYVYAIDGETGTQLWRELIGSLWISSVATGDVNGDNIDDVAFAHEYLAGWDNFYGVLDGTDGEPVWVDTVTYCVLKVIMTDIDDDGQLEAIFGAAFADDHAEFFVRTAANGDLEWSYDLGYMQHTNGDVILGAYDIDKDTDLDLVVGTYIGTYYVHAFDGDVAAPMWTSEPLNGYPRDFGFGDVNGDGEENLIAATYDRVQVLHATTGKKYWYYSVAGTISAVDAADCDNDGVLDVIAGGGAEMSGSNPGKSVWALKTVDSPVWWEYQFGEYGNALVVADLNGDAFMDVVAVNSLGDGAWARDGQDGSELWTWTGTENLYAVTAGDFDNNGQVDVAVAGNDDRVTALNGANGSVMWTYPTGNQIYRKCLQATDLNGDGAVDVIAGCDDSHVYALNGPMGDTLWTYHLGAQATDIKLAQMNAVGSLDIVAGVGSGASGEKVVVINGADGSLLWEFLAPDAVEHVEAFDANNDGVLDVAAAITPYSPKQIIMIDGSTHLQLWSKPIASASNTHSMAHGDLNGDKYPDLVIPGNSTDKVVWALSGENGDTLWTHPVGGEVNCVMVYDVDNDGEDEVVAGSDDQIVYVLDRTDGAEEWSYSTADDVIDLKIGDISGDGLPNIACVTFGSDGVIYTFNSLAIGGNNLPTAFLDNISPNPAYESQMVVFLGHGIDSDGTIAGYEWQSSLDGVLSSDSTFSTSTLSRGVHNTSFRVQDNENAWSEPITDSLTIYLCGDADGDDLVNIADVVYLINYIFGGGPPPDPLLAGDVDCNTLVNIADVVYLINYIFGGGPPPCAGC
ncbi:MAG: PQQ-binding-like beta-propeller repeat protein [candidate division Zixibacteria bacterium]|nr:PQQ-binding-like beta-propeller repeat protein [candidate division Zixibacteria bacterium]